MPTSPAATKMSASPRSAPVPNHSPIDDAPPPSVIQGMTNWSATGAIMNAVSGDAQILNKPTLGTAAEEDMITAVETVGVPFAVVIPF